MAVQEGEYLLLQQHEKLYMLLGGRGTYHLVSVDKKLTEEREAQLLRLYPCSEQTLRELGITVSALKVRGVAANGWEAGDELVLYVGKKKHRYVLSDDSTQAQMALMFDGVEKFQMPKKKQKSGDWRLAKQKKEWIPWMRGIKTVLHDLPSVKSVALQHVFETTNQCNPFCNPAGIWEPRQTSTRFG